MEAGAPPPPRVDLLAGRWRRRLLFGALYFGEGAPIGYLWSALPTRMREADVPVESIGRYLALIALPWSFKVLLGPAVDVFRGERFSLRGWVLVAQIAMAATLLPLFWLDMRADFTLLCASLFAHAVAAATQDVAVDALAIRTTPLAERGTLNGAMQTGMLTGRAVFGGGALLLGAKLGGDEAVTVALLATIVVGALLLRAGVSGASVPPPARTPGGGALRDLLRRLLTSRRTWRGLSFAVLAGAGYEALGGLTGPYLLDSGASAEDVGWVLAGPRLLALLAGALIGGFAADRLSPARTAGVALVAIAAGAVAFSGVEMVLAVHFAAGVFTASSYAWFMSKAEPDLAATQFSTWMGGTNLCESWSALAAASLVPAFGYDAAFTVLALAALLALPLLRRG